MRVNKVTVIGAGLAGSEAALTLAAAGVEVTLIDCKPERMTPASANTDFCELVCSNSLKSNDGATAHGLLKDELRMLGSHVLKAAESCAVPAGSALAVDRARFARTVTDELKRNIPDIRCETAGGAGDGITVIATGPLTLPPMDKFVSDNFGSLHFFDAEAPIVSAESVDMSKAFFAARYGKGDGNDYLNCPLGKEEYDAFYDALVTAERANAHECEKSEIFEGCMPVEVMAARGRDALRFGPMRPVGLTDPMTGKRAYAVVQLRKENAAGDMYNLVGFQTNLKFGEQRRVFGLIPALKNAEFLRYGVMHRNSYIDAPSSIDGFFRSLKNSKIFIAGQLSGVEGYVESIASGKLAAMHALRMLDGKEPLPLPITTIVGALSAYISSPSGDFQPMNANYGLLPPLEREIRDKRARKEAYRERSLADLKKYTESL